MVVRMPVDAAVTLDDLKVKGITGMLILTLKGRVLYMAEPTADMIAAAQTLAPKSPRP